MSHHELSRTVSQRIFDSFGEALEHPAEARAEFLREIEREDPALAAEVRSMLEAHLSTANLELERSLSGAAPGLAPGGGRLGAYRLLRELGRGGMGEVHLAERVDGDFQQLVAVKILRAGLFGAESIQRFHRERNIQARLTHPAVVPILDGGVAPDGRPFLVLQYVEGRPITQFADENLLPVGDRLRLMIQVGRAVDHAHSHLVVHRDLKPSNILVTDEGAVRLLDFGVAKLLDPSDEGSDLTRSTHAPMTPERAAPEQLRGEHPSTATDVWGLGMLLHELLTGRLPYEGAGRSPDEIERFISSREPTRPSRVVAEPAGTGSTRTPERVAAARATTVRRLQSQLRGDLELILARALHPRPERRYRGAAAFTDDLAAFLDGRPVAARPDSLAYRTRRFVARHRAATVAAGLAAVALVSLAVGSLLQSVRVARERDRAALSESQSKAAVDLLVSLFAKTNPRSGSGVTTVMIPDLLAEGNRRVEALVDQPAVQARLWHTLGAIHFERSEREEALRLYDRALAANPAWPATDPDRVGLILDSARALRFVGREDEAKRRLSEVLSQLEAGAATAPGTLARVLQDLGEALGGPEGTALVERSLGIRRADRTTRPDDVAASLHSLAILTWRQGDPARARTLWREALPLVEASKGPDNPDTRAVLGALANVLEDPREQEAIHRRILESIVRQLGPEAQGLAVTWTNLGVALALQRRYSEAEDALAEALRRWESQLGPAHGQTLNCLRSIARLRDLQGQVEDAVTTYAEIRRRRRDAGPGAPAMDVLVGLEADALTRAGRVAESRALLSSELDRLRAAAPNGSIDLASAEVALGRLELARSKPASAVAALRRAVAWREALLPDASPDLAEARAELGRALSAAGNPVEGRALLARHLPAFAANLRAHPADIATLQAALGDDPQAGSSR